MNKILILGASGFTGIHLIKYLVNTKSNTYEVHAADMSKNPTLSELCKYHQIDARKEEDILNLIKIIKPNFIVNLIGTFSAKTWEEFYGINVLVSRNLLDSVLKLSYLDTKILLIGSAAEYGYPSKNPILETDEIRPINYYGLSKAMQTQIALYFADVHKLQVLIARTFNITGEGISASLSVGSFIQQVESVNDGGNLFVGNLESERDFLQIEVVVARYIYLLEHGSTGTVYNICSGKPKKIREILEKIILESGKKLEVIIDKKIFKKNDVPIIYGDPSRFDQLLKKYGNI